MIRTLKSRIARFRRDESGNPTVEFVLIFPLYLGLMAMSVELGMVTLRHTLLERGLDMAVREAARRRTTRSRRWCARMP